LWEKSGKLKTLRKIHFNFSTTHRTVFEPAGPQKKSQSEPDSKRLIKAIRVGGGAIAIVVITAPV